MTDNQKKGIALILGGILFFFLFGMILEIFNLGSLSYFLYEYHLMALFSLGLVGFGINVLISENTPSEYEETSLPQNIHTYINNNNQMNKVVKISLTGGLIGFIAGDAISLLNRRIREENAQGWEVIQVLPDTDANLVTVIIRIILLCITSFLFTTTNGYYVVLKSAIPSGGQPQTKTSQKQRKQEDIYAELSKLAELKEKGVITEDEFAKSKSELLRNS